MRLMGSDVHDTADAGQNAGATSVSFNRGVDKADVVPI